MRSALNSAGSRRRMPRVWRVLVTPNAIAITEMEVVRQRDLWRDFESVEPATLECASRFAVRHVLRSMGDVSPAEKEDSYFGNGEMTTVSSDSPAQAGLVMADCGVDRPTLAHRSTGSRPIIPLLWTYEDQCHQ